MSARKERLIIFDMDNTLIHSRIDFGLMKSETLRLLREAGLEAEADQPVAQILNGMRNLGVLPQELEARIWQRIAEVEFDGLAVATLEEGIEEVLQALQAEVHLAVLTNTAQPAAEESLKLLGLDGYFEYLVGRGGVPALKPQPGGMLSVVAQFPHLTVGETLTVGDALIDIRAAQAAGIRFVAYNSSRQEDWSKAPCPPELQLYRWDAQALTQLLALFAEA